MSYKQEEPTVTPRILKGNIENQRDVPGRQRILSRLRAILISLDVQKESIDWCEVEHLVNQFKELRKEN
jgi:hypothetical protein